MFLKFIFVFCVIPKEYGVIQNVAAIPYKHNKEIQTYNRVNVDNYHENPKNLIKYHFKEDPSDHSNESRRLFDWIKKILHKNDTNATQKIPTNKEVLDEKTRFRLIEKNLTETLTKLSHVLTQILNIVKYSRYQYFDDIHEFLPTKNGKYNLPIRNMERFKRGLDLNIKPININRESKLTDAKLYNRSQGNRDTKEEINMKMDLNIINKINHDNINVGNYENKTKLYTNVSPKNENLQENIAKMDSNKSMNILVQKGHNVDRINADLKRLENFTSKNMDTRNSLKVLKATTKSDANNYFKSTKLLVNDSSFAITNIDSHKNITKRDVTPMKLESIDVNLQEKSRIKRDTKELNKEIVNSTEKTEIITNSEVKQEKTSTKDDDSENSGINKANVSKSGRRILIQTKETKVNDEIKNRLFRYIDEAFNDIMTKIDSLKHTKDMFSKDATYRIGYIISNIDTLEVNMRNLRMDMNRNKYIWDDKKILNLYDTVKVSNQAVSDLLEILKQYVEQSLK